MAVGIGGREIDSVIGGDLHRHRGALKFRPFRHASSIGPVAGLPEIQAQPSFLRLGRKTKRNQDYLELSASEGLVEKIVARIQSGRPREDSVRKRLDTIFHQYAIDWRAWSNRSQADYRVSAGLTIGMLSATARRCSHVPKKDRSMFTAKQYRDKAAEYKRLTATATTPDEKREYQNLEQRFTTLADNEEWMVEHRDQTVHAAGQLTTFPGAPETAEIVAWSVPCNAQA